MTHSAPPPTPDRIFSFLLDTSAVSDATKMAPVHHILTLYAWHQLDRPRAASSLETFLGPTDLLKKFDDLLNAGAAPVRPLLPGTRHKPVRWTAQEDERLVTAIQVHGTENWPMIAAFVGGNRTRAQCAQRWHRGLDPKILKRNWTREEEKKLIDSVRTHGEKAWTRIAADFGNRSDVQCRFRYQFLCKKAAETKTEVAPISAPQGDGSPAGAAPETIPDDAARK
jgi:hypothetical protein